MCQSKVSVVIPCYNHGQYIEESLNSVLEQTYDNIEIIIVNDGSTDEFTNNTLATLVAQKTRVLTTENQGLASARNTGIKSSVGDYILPLDADDKIAPDYIEKAVKVLDRESEIKIVYCYARLFGKRDISWEIPPYSMQRMLRGNIIFCSALFRRVDYEDTRGYNPNMKYGYEDWDFWLSLLESGGKVYRIPEELFFYRKDQASMSSGFDDEKLWLMRRTIYRNHLDLYASHFCDPLNLYFKYKNERRECRKRTFSYYKKKWVKSLRKRL